MALPHARLLLNLLVNESALLAKVEGGYLLLRRGAVFRADFVPNTVVAPLLREGLIAPAVDDDWGWAVLVPTAEGRRSVNSEPSDDA